MNKKMSVLPRNHATGISHDRTGTCAVGPSGPPRNSVTTTADMVMVFMNSAMKNRANRIDEYSVLNPPTSSCSASTRSKGGRLSSAVMAIMKMKKGRMPVRTRYQLPKKVCAWRVDDGPGGQRLRPAGPRW